MENSVVRKMSIEELEEFLRDEFEREFPDSEDEIPHVEFRETNSAFGKRIREFDLVNHGFKDIDGFLLNALNEYKKQMDKSVKEYKLVKTISYFKVEFERAFVNEGEKDSLLEKRTIHLPTKMKEIDSTVDIEEYFKSEIIEYLKKKIDEVMLEGSGFTLNKIEHLTVQLFKYEPLRGAGSSNKPEASIKLPQALKNKKSIVNLINTGNECFKWLLCY